MKQITLQFETIDFWSRPVFRVLEFDSLFVGSLDTLFPNKEIATNNTSKEITDYFKKNKNELVIFGNNIDDDPLGTSIKKSLKIKFKNKN